MVREGNEGRLEMLRRRVRAGCPDEALGSGGSDLQRETAASRVAIRREWRWQWRFWSVSFFGPRPNRRQLRARTTGRCILCAAAESTCLWRSEGVHVIGRRRDVGKLA